jgi:hypothetical protein
MIEMRIVSVLTLACLVLAMSPALHAGATTSSKVVTPNRAGALKLGRSTPDDLRALFGPPRLTDLSHGEELAGYDCRGDAGCYTSFTFATRGQLAGRLIQAVLSERKRGYRTANGTRLGASAAVAERREPDAVSDVICGLKVLRYPGTHRAGPLSGLTLVLGHEKVLSFLVIRGRHHVHCQGGGFTFS